MRLYKVNSVPRELPWLYSLNALHVYPYFRWHMVWPELFTTTRVLQESDTWESHGLILRRKDQQGMSFKRVQG